MLQKYLFYPITFIWAAVLNGRHFLYDKNILKSYKAKVKTICVGNLAFGGTGKTPFVEYLIAQKLQEGYKNIAVVSSGYGRKTQEIIFVNTQHTATQVGDEPLQIKQNFGQQITVVVALDRQAGIEKLLLEKPFTELILLDDAFQHRKIKASTNILLTTFQNPFWNDTLFPSGSLRDVKSRAKAAHEIVVTKCPSDFDAPKAAAFIAAFKTQNKAIDYKFSKIKYQNPVFFHTQKIANLANYEGFLLLTGIANSTTLQQYLTAQNIAFKHLNFPDHHAYSTTDLAKIKAQLEAIQKDKKIIITTQKDAVRLGQLKAEILNLNLEIVYLPIIFEVFSL